MAIEEASVVTPSAVTSNSMEDATGSTAQAAPPEGSYEWLAKIVFKDDAEPLLPTSKTAIDASTNLSEALPMASASGGPHEAQSTPENSITEANLPLNSLDKAPESNQTIKEKDNESNPADDSQKAGAHHILHEVGVRLAFKAKLRLLNQRAAASRPDERHIASLDSNLKKNSGFVRKLRNFTVAQLEGLVRDMSALNLSKYLSEAAAAIVEAKLKVTDVGAAVVLCSLFHQTYAEFAPLLLENWQKVLSLKKDEKVSNPSKLRVDLRLYGDLVSVALFPLKEALTLLGQILSALINADKEDHNNASIILSFCKHCGEDYAGLIPASLKNAALLLNREVPRSTLLLPEKQKAVRTLLSDYFASLCKHLLKDHRDLQALERQNRRILQTKGELNAERKERLETLQQQYQKLLNSAQAFADVLDQPMPKLPEDPVKCEDDTGLVVSGIGGFSDGDDGMFSGLSGLVGGLWEDEETQRFYEDFPNMREYLPGIKSREREPGSSPSPTPVAQVTEEVLDAELTEEDLGNPDIVEPAIVEDEPDEAEQLTNLITQSSKQHLEQFLSHLPNCVNRELVDNAAAEYLLSLNSKNNKRKLVRVLFGVPRTRLDLLPFYARLVATLHPVVPEIAQDLCHMLKQDFIYHVCKKDQINIESKIKVVRFIGELVKFKMYHLIEGLYCLKVLLHDFTHHHVDMACALLETCGRYFLRRPESHQRTKIYLEQMMRKKSALTMDVRYVTMIENAFFFVNPPEGGTLKVKERPPIHSFIRKILYQDLSKPTTDKVFRLIRRLNWEDKDLAAYTIKCLTAAWNVKYYNIRCLASLVAGLAVHQENVAPMVVDGVLEDIRVCMEINHAKLNQRRVAMIKYLGELYNYRVVESNDIFKVLYSLIKFGVSYDPTSPALLDPPDHLFRIRLVCTLLFTCGQFFNSGPSKQKLDYFIVFFQHYYWMKRESGYWASGDTVSALTGAGDGPSPFPMSIEYMFEDAILGLRPTLTLAKNLEEAVAAVEQLESKLLAQLPKSTGVQGDNGELGTITEDSERETDGERENTDDTSSMDETEEDNGAESPYEDELANILDEEDDENDDEEEEMSDSAGIDNDDGNVVKIKRKEQEEVSHEDKEFMDELEQMVSCSIQDHARNMSKPHTVDISIPFHIRTNHKKTYEQLQEANENLHAESNTVNFTLLTRRGNKQSFRNLSVPVSSELALNLRSQEQAERMEMEKVKRLTLDINERLEEEDYQDMLASFQRPTTVNLNRERRNRYQHPKGAPDADLIFGPKRTR
ncbi:Regulator of nonsense transcripts 2 [Frankliniella fusca]|uniref:Regulator of nonsense transcripts 2 n=1 Tax=Frankliniella fusca TaxID=407009 RepID=A0AAE1L9Z8_9NEOP|nr:Regulator of nonsense transcripts 2 [Frankliniella fusca]